MLEEDFCEKVLKNKDDFFELEKIICRYAKEKNWKIEDMFVFYAIAITSHIQTAPTKDTRNMGKLYFKDLMNRLDQWDTRKI